MQVFSLICSNQTDRVFLECLQLLSVDCVRDGSLYRSRIGDVTVIKLVDQS